MCVCVRERDGGCEVQRERETGHRCACGRTTCRNPFLPSVISQGLTQVHRLSSTHLDSLNHCTGPCRSVSLPSVARGTCHVIHNRMIDVMSRKELWLGRWLSGSSMTNWVWTHTTHAESSVAVHSCGYGTRRISGPGWLDRLAQNQQTPGSHSIHVDILTAIELHIWVEKSGILAR